MPRIMGSLSGRKLKIEDKLAVLFDKLDKIEELAEEILDHITDYQFSGEDPEGDDDTRGRRVEGRDN